MNIGTYHMNKSYIQLCAWFNLISLVKTKQQSNDGGMVLVFSTKDRAFKAVFMRYLYMILN